MQSDQLLRPGTPVCRTRVASAPAIGWRAFLPIACAIFTALILVLFVRVFARTVAVLTLSIAIADSFAPLIARMQRTMSRTAASALVYGLLLLALTGALVFLAPPLTSEIAAFVGQAPRILDATQDRIASWVPGFALPSGFTPHDLAAHLVPDMVQFPLSVGASLITTALVFFLSFYWLVAAPSVHAFVQSLFPENLHADVADVLRRISCAMGGYLRGVAINAAVIGALVWIGLHLAGIPYAFPLSMISACGEFVPYLGPVIAAVPGILVAALESPEKVLIVLAIYVGIIQIEGHVLTPNIMKSQTDLPQVVVIIALFAGGAIGGVLGALVAVPLAGAAMVLVDVLVVPAIRRWTSAHLGAEDGPATDNGL